jgi:hypothetical protein
MESNSNNQDYTLSSSTLWVASQSIKVDDGLSFIMEAPLQVEWDPKEDITTYELAKAMPYLLSNGLYIMPGMWPEGEPFTRHFNVYNPNE